MRYEKNKKEKQIRANKNKRKEFNKFHKLLRVLCFQTSENHTLKGILWEWYTLIQHSHEDWLQVGNRSDWTQDEKIPNQS